MLPTSDHVTAAARRRARIEAFAEGQEGMVSRAQLRRLEVTRHQVRTEVRAKRWQLIGPRVVALHTGSLCQAQREWAAVLHAGPRAALCGITAAVAGGFNRVRGMALDERVHVVVPRGSRAASLEHPLVVVRLHESRRLDPDDIHPVLRPPRTRVERSVIDAAIWAPTDGEARAVLAAAVQQRLVRPEALHARLSTLGPVRRRALLIETVMDVIGGSHSVPELDFVRALRRAGLPLPLRQVRVRRDDGTWFLDAEWEEYALVVEVDGAQHTELLAREADDERRNALEVEGRRVLRFSSWALRHREAEAMTLLRRGLLAGGWQPADTDGQQTEPGGVRRTARDATRSA